MPRLPNLVGLVTYDLKCSRKLGLTVINPFLESSPLVSKIGQIVCSGSEIVKPGVARVVDLLAGTGAGASPGWFVGREGGGG